MAQTLSTKTVDGVHTPPGAGAGPTLALAVFLVCLSALSLARLAPPGAVAADAPPEVFSSARALSRLEAISRGPHPIGSGEHARVRAYLTRELAALGVAPEVQTTTVVSARRSNFPRAATVSNVVGRLRGAGGGKAVLLVAHYDTVPNSPGAGDDGSGVVTLLESLRALRAGPALKNDVIFLFTDGEEAGLLGARAFVEEHPYAREVGVVLNYEARGSSGPAIMFETSRDNGWLVGQFADAAPHPRANSLSYEIYRLLPNDTDLTVFKEAGHQGLNFAFIDGFTRYHARTDDLGNIDERSLQHQGSYALALARHFGNLDPPAERAGNVIYSDVLGAAVFTYSARWVLPLTALAAVLFVALTWYGWRKGGLTVRGVALGAAAFTLSLILAAGLAALCWWLIAFVQGRLGRSTQDDFYQSRVYLGAFTALCVAAVTAVYGRLGRGANAGGLLAGAQLCWLLLLALVSVALPGGSYILLWPLLFSLAAAAFFLTGGGQTRSLTSVLVVALCSSPAVVLLVPMIYQLYVGVGLPLIGLVAALTALLLGLLTAQAALLGGVVSRYVPAGAAVAGLVLLALAAFTFNFDGRHPKTDNVFYALNADTGQATWASADAAPDQWSAQFFGDRVERGPLGDFSPLHPGRYLKAPAPALALGAPQARLLDAGDAQGVRTLNLSLAPQRAGAQLTAFLDARFEVLSAAVNGKKIVAREPRAGTQAAQPWVLQYWAAPAEGFRLTLEVRAAEPVKLVLVERTDGLPEIPGRALRPRPDDLMPAPGQSSDATLVSKSYSF